MVQAAHEKAIVSSYRLLNHVHLELWLRSFCGKQLPEAPSVVPVQMSMLSQILEVIPILHACCLPLSMLCRGHARRHPHVRDPYCWYRGLAGAVTTTNSMNPSVEFVVHATQYAYKPTWNTSLRDRRLVLDQLWKQVTTNYTTLNCLATAADAKTIAERTRLQKTVEFHETS